MLSIGLITFLKVVLATYYDNFASVMLKKNAPQNVTYTSKQKDSVIILPLHKFI